ncbi:MAG: hypothetical protein KAI94_09595 [Anaerolineales bacterium]|nr:hypothetical protein [Anaerolineales bacterium]
MARGIMKLITTAAHNTTTVNPSRLRIHFGIIEPPPHRAKMIFKTAFLKQNNRVQCYAQKIEHPILANIKSQLNQKVKGLICLYWQ